MFYWHSVYIKLKCEGQLKLILVSDASKIEYCDAIIIIMKKKKIIATHGHYSL